MKWATSNAATVRLDGRTVEAVGQEDLSLSKARTLVLSVANARGSLSRVLVLQPPDTQLGGNSRAARSIYRLVKQFARIVNPRTNVPTLVWQVSSAGKVTIDGRAVSAVGHQVERAGSATYRLSAANRFGTVLSTLTVSGSAAGAGGKVRKIALPQPGIASFTLQPATNATGSRLSWRTNRLVLC